ncbi:hypothetical protein EV421DRAFT_1900793 [Armillaria borealis]|uniref:Uncharacterized protein n=1 Tax=Armillaria borealis TaxID=47425 RepID=A0AA39MW09_9AGAR|nr:hypothetical protein EV421DRAFT_1900793 [Armillaria borealis]
MSMTLDEFDEFAEKLRTFEPPAILSPKSYDRYTRNWRSILFFADKNLTATMTHNEEAASSTVNNAGQLEDPINEIMAHVEDDLITLELLMVNLCPGKCPKYKKREMEFFIRLVTGYAYASVDQIKAIFDPDSRPGKYTWTAACKTLTDINKNKDLNERLLERDRHLLNQPEAEGLADWIRYVVYMTTSILFAHDYALLNDDDKDAYVLDLCGTIRESALVGDEESRTAVRNQFYNEHRRTVTARNHYLSLFHLFGASVLLDPTIDIRTRTGIPTLSATFPKTFGRLRKEFKSDDIRLTRLHNDNSALLLNMLQVLGSEDVVKLVRDFLATFDKDTEDESG